MHARQRWFGIWFVLLLGIAGGANAVGYDDAAALRGIETGKGVFLIDFDNPQKLAFYLRIIKGSYEGMQRQGVRPDFVVVFIGPTVKYLTTAPDDEVAMRFEGELKAVAEAVTALDGIDVRLEVCSIANQAFGVDNDRLLPGLTVVGDGFISLIGYQTQGYQLVPIF
jgi:intracellular sulfur oxidation DsrE/DsrF family protein